MLKSSLSAGIPEEFRTPWACASFQKMELHLAENMMLIATQTPGYLENNFFELPEKGKVQEAEAIRAEFPEIVARDIGAEYVQAVNEQTILNGDRFVFSPFPSSTISHLFKGECQNYRLVV